MFPGCRLEASFGPEIMLGSPRAVNGARKFLPFHEVFLGTPRAVLGAMGASTDPGIFLGGCRKASFGPAKTLGGPRAVLGVK